MFWICKSDEIISKYITVTNSRNSVRKTRTWISIYFKIIVFKLNNSSRTRKMQDS